MQTKAPPTIKGIFVLSHIKALQKERGNEAVEELKRRYGKSLDFRASDNVPVTEEHEILEHIVDMLSPKMMNADERTYEAGRLHMKNFSTTPMWLLLSPALKHSPKWIFLQSHHVAELVFEGVIFESREVTPTTVQIRMEHGGSYPIGHFQGFLYEMISASQLIGAVESEVDTDGAYIYTITWK